MPAAFSERQDRALLGQGLCRTPSVDPRSLLHQIGHYVPRPSRLFIAALLLPSHFPRLLTLLLSILPVDWPQGERGKAFRLAVGNLVRAARPAGAGVALDGARAGTGSRATEEYFLGAVCLCQGLGRMREATALFARANERDVAQTEALGRGALAVSRAR